MPVASPWMGSARETDSWRFLDALAWNWIIGGTDAHAKNYSLLLRGREVRLAPLYDVAAALPYVHEQDLKLAMRLGGDYRMGLWTNQWPRVAQGLGLPEGGVQSRVAELVEVAPEAFRVAVDDDAIRALGSALPDALAEQVAARAQRCRRQLVG